MAKSTPRLIPRPIQKTKWAWERDYLAPRGTTPAL